MRTGLGRSFGPLIACLCLLWIALPVLASEKKVLEDRAAVVNGVVITQEDFKREMSGVLQRLLARGRSISDSQFQELRKNVLENLINLELFYQEAKKSGVKVDDAAVEDHLSSLKKRFQSEEKFKKALEEMNLSEAELRAQTGKTLVVKKFIDEQVVQDIPVSDKELKTYYDSHPESFKRPEQVKASHILIKVEPEAKEAEKDAARKKIKEVQQRLKSGEDFATLAKELSEGPSKARGGDLGYIRRGQMVGPFEKAAFALKPGEVSEVVETKFGYHLIKCFEKRPETVIAYDDVKERLRQFLRDQKARDKVGAYVEELKKKAKVERFLTEKP